MTVSLHDRFRACPRELALSLDLSTRIRVSDIFTVYEKQALNRAPYCSSELLLKGNDWTTSALRPRLWNVVVRQRLKSSGSLADPRARMRL